MARPAFTDPPAAIGIAIGTAPSPSRYPRRDPVRRAGTTPTAPGPRRAPTVRGPWSLRRWAYTASQMIVPPADGPPAPPAATARGRNLSVGCGLLAALAVGVPLGGGGLWAYTAYQAHQAALAEQARHAEEVFAPALEQL